MNERTGYVERGILYRDIGTFECAAGHRFDSSEGRLSPLESRECPVCRCAARLLEVASRPVSMNP